MKSEGSPFRALAHHKMSELSPGRTQKNAIASVDIPVLTKEPSYFDSSNILSSPVQTHANEVAYSPSRPSHTKPGAIFKVISTSPSKFANKIPDDSTKDVISRTNEQRKIVNKSSVGLGLSGTGNKMDSTFQGDDKNGVSDFTFASDINNETNERLVKLQVNSREDLVEEIYHTPLEDPSETFSEGMFEKFGSSSPSTLKLTHKQISPQQGEKLSPANNKNIPHDTTEEEDDGNILDDLEFSSFDMTFGTTNGSSNTQSPVAIEKKEQGNVMHGLRYSHIPKMEPPVMYRYSRDASVDNKNSSNIERRNVTSPNYTVANDDDPFWISPSKLDFTSIANSAKKSATNNRTLDSSVRPVVSDKTASPIHEKKKEHSTESTLSHDMSFAFLGNIVELNSADEGNERSKMYAGDKPTRLHFN